MNDTRIGAGDSLRESAAPPDATAVGSSVAAYPTDEWESTYFSVSHQGALVAHRVAVRVPAGLADVCPPVRIGQPGCVYAVRRWGFALRPSVLEAAGFDSILSLTSGDDVDALRTVLRAASFDLPGEFVIASPEHPFRLVGSDGLLRGSFTQWWSYLGALAFFASGGRVRASFLRFWAEAEESYRQAVDYCLAALSDIRAF